jgi:hypothetical protein
MRWRLKSAEWGAMRDSAARRAHVDPAEDIHTSRSLRQEAAIRRRTSRDRRHRWCIKLSINFKSLSRRSLPERSQSAKFTPQPCQRSAGSFLGTKRSFLWTVRSILGTGLFFLGTERPFLGTERPFLGTGLSFLWTERSFLGTAPSFLGTGPSFLGTERSFLWTGPSFLWTEPSFLGTERSFRSHDTPCARKKAEPMGKRRFTHRPCVRGAELSPGPRPSSPPAERDAQVAQALACRRIADGTPGAMRRLNSAVRRGSSLLSGSSGLEKVAELKWLRIKPPCL